MIYFTSDLLDIAHPCKQTRALVKCVPFQSIPVLILIIFNSGPPTLRLVAKKNWAPMTRTGFTLVQPQSRTSSIHARRLESMVFASTTAPSVAMEQSQNTTAKLQERTSASVWCNLKKQVLLELQGSTLRKEPPSLWERLSPRRESWTWIASLLRLFKRRREANESILVLRRLVLAVSLLRSCDMVDRQKESRDPMILHWTGNLGFVESFTQMLSVLLDAGITCEVKLQV